MHVPAHVQEPETLATILSRGELEKLGSGSFGAVFRLSPTSNTVFKLMLTSDVHQVRQAHLEGSLRAQLPNPAFAVPFQTTMAPLPFHMKPDDRGDIKDFFARMGMFQDGSLDPCSGQHGLIVQAMPHVEGQTLMDLIYQVSTRSCGKLVTKKDSDWMHSLVHLPHGVVCHQPHSRPPSLSPCKPVCFWS